MNRTREIYERLQILEKVMSGIIVVLKSQGIIKEPEEFKTENPKATEEILEKL
jgi:hypothetical protein